MSVLTTIKRLAVITVNINVISPRDIIQVLKSVQGSMHWSSYFMVYVLLLAQKTV
jgi:hypothetical protein